MRIEIKNIGKIHSADITIDGITVIGGKNGTGKSTISRALFSMFNGFYNFRNTIYEERCSAIRRYVGNYISAAEIIAKFSSINDIKTLEDYLIAKKKENNNRDFILYDSGNPENIEETAKSVFAILNIADEEILRRIIRNSFSEEFNGQPLNIYSEKDGEVSIYIKDRKINVKISKNSTTMDGEFELTKNAIYIDDPFVIDNLDKLSKYSNTDYNHSSWLLEALRPRRSKNAVDSILSDRKLTARLGKLNSVCGGIIVSKSSNPEYFSEFSYVEKNTEKKLRLQNLSSGLKTFVLLKLLIENGALEDNGVIIFDEPEIHLHPEWQLVLAELIVLIQKEFSMHILINTHSPYFLDAIDVYAARYCIKGKCHFYLSADDGSNICFEDVSDDIEKLYKLLAKPFQDLENLRNRGIDEV